MPFPLIWVGVLGATAVVSAVAYGISQLDDDDSASSGPDPDAERRQREAQQEQTRQKIQAEADAWLRSQRIRLVTDAYERFLHQLQAGQTLDAPVWAALTRASPSIQHAEAEANAEAQRIDEYRTLLEALDDPLNAVH